MPPSPQTPLTALTAAVDDERKKAAVRPLDMSLNELADMYCNKELNIAPAYQRGFRWAEEKQSQFIESLILDMPIPPLYVMEMAEGEWELIDGLQRLSTYLYFRGLLNNPDRDPPIQPGEVLTLTGCDIVASLNGFKFDDLPTTLQYRVKRAPMRIEVVKKETNPRFRYHMFKRLNTGGEHLSDQEVRNCTIRLLGDEFNRFLQEMAQDGDFRICTDTLSDASRAQMGLEELVLRFFAFKNGFDDYVHSVGPFMTNYMERVSDRESRDHIAFDFAAERQVFKNTFGVLAITLGVDTCRRWGRNGPTGGFSAHHFEALSIGVARVYGSVSTPFTTEQRARVQIALEHIKQDETFRELTTGGGKNSRGMYARKIEFVETKLREVQ